MDLPFGDDSILVAIGTRSGRIGCVDDYVTNSRSYPAIIGEQEKMT
ncbi:MAG: hypothetical protein NXH87_08305 [Rhodobiaceae bacterium]|nr:hypothetical protein [Rhodobiaceae bacterium]